MGEDACPVGYSPIYDSTECQAAANQFGYDYDANAGDKDDTLLCNYCSGCSPLHVELSSSHGSKSYWLCKEG